MSIEVTSVPDTARILSADWLRQVTRPIQWHGLIRERLLLRFIIGVIAVGVVLGGDSLLRSYKYYSRIIDARLASGYLTSRPGLYAAPRLLRPGQKLSQTDLIVALRRAGYVKSEGSNVWSGSFRETSAAIEIRANANQTRSALVKISFDGDKRISELTNNDIPTDSFTLEPEVLSNDPLSKAGKREAVRFSEIPAVLVHAILATEDRRFFEHPGVDVFA